MKRPAISRPGLYDPTEVMNRANTSLYMKEGFIKIGFCVCVCVCKGMSGNLLIYALVRRMF